MSFRSTTSAINYTNRGFKLVVDKGQKKLRFVFNPDKVDMSNDEIAKWLEFVKERVGLGPLNPEPYWGFDDLKYAIGSKINSCFYVAAESKVEDGHEYFLFRELYLLNGFSFNKFLNCLDSGKILVDFDARTGHNHGTKFRIRQGIWINLYDSVQRAI